VGFSFGLLDGQSSRSFLFFQQGQMRCQLLSKIIIDASATKKIPEPA
jgi:hypothetical protein